MLCNSMAHRDRIKFPLILELLFDRGNISNYVSVHVGFEVARDLIAKFFVECGVFFYGYLQFVLSLE